MKDVEFLKFEQTTNGKSFGVATLRFLNAIILRYKVMERVNKDGYYCAPASMHLEVEGHEMFVKSFMLESAYMAEEIENLVVREVAKLHPVKKLDIPS